MADESESLPMAHERCRYPTSRLEVRHKFRKESSPNREECSLYQKLCFELIRTRNGPSFTVRTGSRWWSDIRDPCLDLAIRLPLIPCERIEERREEGLAEDLNTQFQNSGLSGGGLKWILYSRGCHKFH